VSYEYKAVPNFWKKFYALNSAQKQAVREAWAIFKNDPFDARLRTHKIHSLSAEFGKTVYAVAIESDLRVVFLIRGNTVISVDVGSHDIYDV
jgi:mRNA-degrading endonuclease YafQ of YafQ-DinJ toxin-antitoxin module